MIFMEHSLDFCQDIVHTARVETNQQIEEETKMNLSVKSSPVGYFILCASDHPAGDPLRHNHDFDSKARAEAFRLHILASGGWDSWNPKNWTVIDPRQVEAWEAGFLDWRDWAEACGSSTMMAQINGVEIY